MKIKDYLWISNRNLFRRKARTLLTILAVVIGATMITLMFSLALGVKRALIAEIQNTGSLTEITVGPAISAIYGGGPGGDSELSEVKSTTAGTTYLVSVADSQKVKQINHVVQMAGMAHIEPKSIRLKGSDKHYPAQFSAVEISPVTEVDLASGRNFKSGDEQKVILGKMYVKTLGAEKGEDLIGKTLLIRLVRQNPTQEDVDKYIRKNYPPANQNGQGVPESVWKKAEEEYRQNPEYKDFEAEIIGVSSSAFEPNQNYLPIGWAEEFFSYQWNDSNHIEKDGYNSLTVKVDSEENVSAVVEEIKNLGLSAQSIKDMLGGILNIFKIIQTVLGVFGGIALVVAMIGIINTMLMSIYERTREIGVMRATGASSRNVYSIFTAEAAAIGFWGGALGIGLAWLIKLGLVFGMNRWVIGKVDTSNDPVLSLGAANLFDAPFWLLAGVIVLTTWLGISAGFLPARRAAKMDPVEALKFE